MLIREGEKSDEGERVRGRDGETHKWKGKEGKRVKKKRRKGLEQAGGGSYGGRTKQGQLSLHGQREPGQLKQGRRTPWEVYGTGKTWQPHLIPITESCWVPR